MCEYSSAYSSAFAICVPTGGGGVPSLLPPGYGVRKRPQIIEASGVGYVSVIGTATATAEVCATAELLITVEGFGHLVSEAFRFLIGLIRSGAEAVITGESSIRCDAAILSVASAKLVGETMASGAGGQSVNVSARMVQEGAASGRGAIRHGGEAVMVPQESDEAIILAAEMLRRLLTTSRT